MPFSIFSNPPTAFLPLVKAHLRIDHDEEDGLLSLYVCAAFEYIEHFTRTPWPDYTTLPPELPVAALLLVADMYENREAQTEKPLSENKTVERLLWPHRVFDP